MESVISRWRNGFYERIVLALPEISLLMAKPVSSVLSIWGYLWHFKEITSHQHNESTSPSGINDCSAGHISASVGRSACTLHPFEPHSPAVYSASRVFGKRLSWRFGQTAVSRLFIIIYSDYGLEHRSSRSYWLSFLPKMPKKPFALDFGLFLQFFCTTGIDDWKDSRWYIHSALERFAASAVSLSSLRNGAYHGAF